MIREYQTECVESSFNAIEQGQNSILNVLATGLGKTVIASEIIKRVQPARSLFFAHRDTLIYQARNTIERFAGVKCGIEMAELKVDYGLFSQDQVVIGTVQTQNSGNSGAGRMALFRPTDFDYLFLDEAHHWVAPSFKKVIDHYRKNPRLKIIGFTATPDRADEEALSQVFSHVAYEYNIIDGIDDGWLVPISQMMVPVEGLDYSHIKTTAGDLNLGQLSDVMEEEETVQRMIQPTLEAAWTLKQNTLDFSPVEDWGSVIRRKGKTRRTLVFCTSVVQAQRFAEVMNRVRPGMATAVWDKVPKNERQQIFKDFSSGVLQVLVNVGICGEGFDNPGVELIVMGRATKSRSLYTQIIGRALRPIDDVVSLLNDCKLPESRRQIIQNSKKPTALIMDFVGNSGPHKLISTLDILGGKVSGKALGKAKKKLLTKEGPVPVTELLEASEEEVRKRIERAKREAENRRVKLVARSKYQMVEVDPFDTLSITPVAPKSFDMAKKLTESQQSLLRKFGINPDKYGYTQAKQLFIEVVKRMKNRMSSPGQIECLKRNGVDATKMSHKEASQLIDKLKKNNWRLPPRTIIED